MLHWPLLFSDGFYGRRHKEWKKSKEGRNVQTNTHNKKDFKCSCPIDSGTRSIWVGLYWFMLIFHSLRSEFFVKRSNTKKWNEILFDLLWWRHLWFIPFLKQPSNVQWVNYASIDWIVLNSNKVCAYCWKL